jgi:hypothetical protein
MEVFKNMSQCDKLITEACNISLSGSEAVENCSKIMANFRAGADACKSASTNCSCWNTLVKDVQAVKDCNIGKSNFSVLGVSFEYENCY